MTTQSYPAGLILDVEATPTAVSRPHDSVVIGVVGTAGSATATGSDMEAKYGEVYELNSLLGLTPAEWTEFDGVTRGGTDAITPANFFGAGSLLDTLILAENIGNFTVVAIPVAGTNGTVNATVAAVNALDPEIGGGSHPKPGIVFGPDAIAIIPTPAPPVPPDFDPNADMTTVAGALRTIAGRLNAQAVVRIPAGLTTAAARKEWAGTYVPEAASPGTIRRTRVTLGTSRTGVTGSRDVGNDAILGVYMALVQSEDLGEDPANTATVIQSTTPTLAFDIEDFTTAAQDLVGAFITPVVRYGGGFRFWGRASGPDPDDDHGYIGVLDAILTEIKALLGSYSQRNLPGETIDIIVSRAQHLVDARRRLGQIADGAVSRHPTLDTPARIAANELYLLLSVQRVPYGRIIHLEVSPHGVAVVSAAA